MGTWENRSYFLPLTTQVALSHPNNFVHEQDARCDSTSISSLSGCLGVHYVYIHSLIFMCPPQLHLYPNINYNYKLQSLLKVFQVRNRQGICRKMQVSLTEATNWKTVMFGTLTQQCTKQISGFFPLISYQKPLIHPQLWLQCHHRSAQ